MQLLKKLKITLKSYELYYSTIFIFCLILTLNNLFFSIILIIYILVFYKKINWLISSIIVIIIVMLFQVAIKNDSKISNQKALITNLEKNNYGDLVTLKIKGKKYHYYLKHENFEIGELINLNANVILYDDVVIPLGFNQRKYYLNNNIYGKLADVIIDNNQRKTVFYYLNKIRDNLKTDEVLIDSIIFNNKTSLPDNYLKNLKSFNIIHLINLSSIHIFFILTIVKKLMFKLNYQLRTQIKIELLIISIIYFFSNYKITIFRILIYSILKAMKKIKNIKITNYSLMHISYLLPIFINPYLLTSTNYLMSFIIVNAIMLTKPLYYNKPFYFKNMIISLLIALVIIPFTNELNIISILLMPIFIVLIVYIVYPLVILTFLFSPFKTVLLALVNAIFIVISKFDVIFNPLIINFPKINFFLSMVFYILLFYLITKNDIKEKIVYILSIILIVYTPVIRRKILSEQLYFLDVGQGDSFVYIDKDTVILVDVYVNVLEFLKNKGIKKIDYLILSHSDLDHTNEALEIINYFNVKNIIVSRYDTYNDLEYINTTKVSDGYKIDKNSVKLEFFGPIKDYYNSNNNSLVFKMTTKHNEILFTGDIELEAELDIAEKYGSKLKSDILKVAHHGSKTSSSELFLKYVKPDKAIISVGKNNRFGFPHEKAFSNIMKYTNQIYQTGLDKTIIIYENKIYKFSYLIMKKRRFIV